MARSGPSVLETVCTLSSDCDERRWGHEKRHGTKLYVETGDLCVKSTVSLIAESFLVLGNSGQEWEYIWSTGERFDGRRDPLVNLVMWRLL